MIVVDRIEGSYAVCETDTGFLNVRLADIEGRVREGALLNEKNGKYVVDEGATEERSRRMREKGEDLWS
jgi:hypothetical protein